MDAAFAGALLGSLEYFQRVPVHMLGQCCHTGRPARSAFVNFRSQSLQRG